MTRKPVEPGGHRDVEGHIELPVSRFLSEALRPPDSTTEDQPDREDSQESS